MASRPLHQASSVTLTALDARNNSSQANILANRLGQNTGLGLYKSTTAERENPLVRNSIPHVAAKTPASKFKDSRTSTLSTTAGSELRLHLSKNKSMLAFNQQIDAVCRTRFYAIQGHIEMLLVKYTNKRSLLKSAVPQKPMVIRLMTLGEFSDCAKPYIVVFCAPEIRKRIQHFFDTDTLVQAFCKPDDASIPAFDVVVCGCEPRLRNDASASVIWETVDDLLLGVCIETKFQDTYCGTPIQFQANGKCRNSTVGGVIKFMDRDGKMSVWGLTAGHAARACLVSDGTGLENETAHNSDADGTVEHYEDDYESCFDSESEDMNWDEDEMYEESPHPATATPLEGTKHDADRPWEFMRPTPFGHAVLSSLPQSEPSTTVTDDFKPSFDWALVPIRGASLNLLPGLNSGPGSYIRITCEKTPSQVVTDKPVQLIRAGSGVRKGRLLPQPSRICINPGDDFVDVFIVTLGDTEAFCDGDSGAWVILEDTQELLGHVVATDCFGAAYVMPASQVFRDIEKQLKVTNVSLPTSADILAMEGAQSLRPQRVSSAAANSSSLFSADRFSTKLEDFDVSVPSMNSFANSTTGYGAASSPKRRYVPFHSLLVAGTRYPSSCRRKTAPVTADAPDDHEGSLTYEPSPSKETHSSHNITADFSRFQLASRETDDGDDLDTSVAEFPRF